MNSNSNIGYFLSYIVAGSNAQPPGEELLASMKFAESKLGIRIWAMVYSHFGKTNDPDYRFFFTLPEKIRDDARANMIAESFFQVLQFVDGQLDDFDGHMLCLPFSIKDQQISDGVSESYLKSEAERLEVGPFDHYDNLPTRRSIGLSESSVAAAWRYLPLAISHIEIREAISFLTESQRSYFIAPGCLREEIASGSEVPESTMRRSKMETAFQNAFKAIESVIGEPPSQDRSFYQKLRSIGIDPRTQVGYERKADIAQAIRDFKKIRDKKAAHGKTGRRGISRLEIAECQECAMYVIERCLEYLIHQEK